MVCSLFWPLVHPHPQDPWCFGCFWQATSLPRLLEQWLSFVFFQAKICGSLHSNMHACSLCFSCFATPEMRSYSQGWSCQLLHQRYDNTSCTLSSTHHVLLLLQNDKDRGIGRGVLAYIPIYSDNRGTHRWSVMIYIYIYIYSHCKS